MVLKAASKLDPLLGIYPFLVEFLAGLSPKFEKLKNPILRKTVGKAVSVEVVNKILAAFKAGARNEAEFWIETGGKTFISAISPSVTPPGVTGDAWRSARMSPASGPSGVRSACSTGPRRRE